MVLHSCLKQHTDDCRLNRLSQANWIGQWSHPANTRIQIDIDPGVKHRSDVDETKKATREGGSGSVRRCCYAANFVFRLRCRNRPTTPTPSRARLEGSGTVAAAP